MKIISRIATIAGAVVVAAFVNVPVGWAGVITFSSHAGGGGQTCFGNEGGGFTGLDANGIPTGSLASGDCVQIDPHPLWKLGAQANVFVDDGSASLMDPAPVWISYANTGFGGDHLATPTSNFNVEQPNMIVTQAFTLYGSGLASLRQWADDTLDVYIDGTLLPGAATHNFSQNICANGSPGCEPGESSFGQIDLSAGDHVFTWVIWQQGSGQDPSSNPFGLLYVGEVDVRTAVPEPITVCLFTLGIGGLGLMARRRRNA